MKNILIIFLILILCYVPLASAMDGTGTVEDPYQVVTLMDLQAIKDGLSGHYKLMNDIDASETLTWNNGEGFIPIGTLTTTFTGSIDGDNFTISNLHIDKNDNYIAFVGYGSTSSEIKNLRIVDADVRSNYHNVAILVARAEGTVTNCFVSGSASGQSLVGLIAGYTQNADISRCGGEGEVSATVTGAGGLFGNLNTGSTASNCYANVTVTGDGDTSWVGGFVGDIYNAILTNCYAIGSATAGGTDVGGFVGDNSGSSTVTSCYWDTEISGNVVSEAGVGKTTAEMMLQTTYVDWDFTDIWSIDSEINNGYPYLFADIYPEPEPEPEPEETEEAEEKNSAYGVIIIKDNEPIQEEIEITEELNEDEPVNVIFGQTFDDSKFPWWILILILIIGYCGYRYIKK